MSHSVLERFSNILIHDFAQLIVYHNVTSY